jgi:hypothetical protein
MGTGLASKLRQVQNNLAHIVCDAPGRSWGKWSNQELLRELPVADCINFKIALLCFKVHRLLEPLCLHTLVRLYVPARCLCSSDERDQLAEIRPNLATAAWRFSLVAPAVWNSLPLATRQAKTVGVFKTALKTGLRSAATV